MNEKRTGYIMLGIGILIMIFAAIQIVLVFTGKAVTMPLFEASQENSGFDLDGLLQQIQQTSPYQVPTAGTAPQTTPTVSLMDTNSINKALNLMVYYFIMQFLLGLGYKLASLGVQLIRPIEVVMKNRSFNTEEQPKKPTIN
ncbi:MAG: hypothetical protein ACEQSA_03610 [Weeksellaceae bacterium]